MNDSDDLDWSSTLALAISLVLARWHREIDGLAELLHEALDRVVDGTLDHDGLLNTIPASVVAPFEAKLIIIQICREVRSI
jgi:hypothetical protein